jgi:hypothetical protein
MAEKTAALKGYPGFGTQYDENEKPFFVKILQESLDKIASCDLGKSLLKDIADANPASRSDFPDGINIMCKPTSVEYTQSGYVDMGGTMYKKKDDSFDGECRFYKRRGGSHNVNVDNSKAENGQGTVCKMFYTNAQIMTGKGEPTLPFIVLAHELIHSYNGLYGCRHPSEEEERTTGLGKWKDEKYSENAFRAAFKIALREEY